MRLQARSFLGMRPAISADLLTAGESQSAVNVRLTGGDLRALGGLGTTLLTLNGAPQVVSVYRFGQSVVSDTQYWFQSSVDTDYAKGPIDNDTEERTFFTDGVFPKKTNAALALGVAPYPSASYAAGVPFPASVPSVAVTGTATDPTSPGETVVYVMTYVSSWGEEGGPSLASTAVTWRAGQTLSLSGLAVAPGAGAHGENYNITGKRLYRSATGSQATQFQLVTTSADIAIATTTYSDTKLTSTLGEVLVTTGFNEPLYNMIGLAAGPNGMMAGFAGNTLCFCQPNLPYAWPARYQRSHDAPIVGIAWLGQSVFVGTTQGIYLWSGADPANMTGDKLPVAQSVASKRSVVAMNGGIMFASPDGLMRLDAGNVTNVTEEIMTRREWQAYLPTSISAYESDNRYLAYYNNGSVTGGMIFAFGQPSTFSLTDTYAFAGFRDKKADALFVATAGNLLKKFDTPGAVLPYTWVSGVFHMPADESMAAASVDASAYPVTFKLYADGALKHTQTVANRFAFRLPAGYRSKRYHFEVSCDGTAVIRDVEIATSMDELTEQ